MDQYLNIWTKNSKLDEWVPHELNENETNRPCEVCSVLFFLRSKIIPFLGGLVPCDEKLILYDDRRRSGKWRNRKENLNAFQNRKNVYSHWRRRKLDLYTTVSWILVSLLQLRNAAGIVATNIKKSQQKSSCTKFPVTDEHYRNWMNWTTKLYLIHATHLTSRRLITTSSNIWITSYKEKFSAV